ncbi:MAG: sigma-54-dependent Fis family transcriptional regulator [Pyrinomonadaceae bacterium]|nr:sigma-54-dependent Fis family transcriptional regulator [Pyrinomonadaceae bacterium]
MKKDLYALVIDDDPQIRRFIRFVLESRGWTVHEAQTAQSAFEKMTFKPWNLIFCDVVLENANGYEILRTFNAQLKDVSIVLMTGYGSAVGALEATHLGARDYLVKPFFDDDIIKIAAQVERSIGADSDAEATVSRLEAPRQVPPETDLVGRSQLFIDCLKLVGRVAMTELPVLVTGESGTGKEVIANSLHQTSDRSKGNFIAVNCGAIPAELIESELFGHAKGAFTGAERDRAGLWEEAHGGTIFLDEITETTPFFQVKLLRILQQGEIRRVGSNKIIKVDVRVIAATNRNIEEDVEAGRFRQDLMYRLNAVKIEIPPLRKRREDILLLAEHFAEKYKPPDRASVRFSRETCEILLSHRWKGNVRELENVVLHAVSLSDGMIYPNHLPKYLSEPEQSADTPLVSTKNLGDEEESDFFSLAEMQRKYVEQVMQHTGGNKQAAARILQVDRKTISRILSRSG